MKSAIAHFRFVFCIFILVLAFSNSRAHAQVAPVCGSDPTCTPDTSASSYGGTALARPKILNARGYSGALVAKAPTGTCLSCGGLPTVIGSQSYNYTVPIASLPGRAGMDLALNLYYNSRVVAVDTVDSTVTFNADRDFPSYGFRLDFGYMERITGVAFILTESDGAKTALTYGPALMLYSSDGRAIQYSESTSLLTYENGTQVQYSTFPSNSNLLRPVWIKNANGDYISITYVSGHDQSIYQVTDSLGRVITFLYDSSNRLTSLSQQLQASGSKTLVNFTWGTPYASGYTWYSFSGLTANGFPTAAQFNALSGCTYPDGTGYRFTYGDWGTINKIEQLSSTGATRSYVSYNYPLASAGALTDAPAYTLQTVSPDSGTSNNSVWHFNVSKAGTGAVSSMTVTDPNGTLSTTNLDSSGMSSTILIQNSSGTFLRTTTTSWTTVGSWPITSTVLASTITTLNDTGQTSSVSYGYDSYGNMTDIYEYGFSGALKRHSVSAYNTNSAYINKHILSLPTQVLVKDGSGNTVSRTDMAYDSTSLTSITGAPGHDDTSYGSSVTTRGNLTSVTRYSNAAAGTGAITRTFNYDSLGNLTAGQFDCCVQKIFTFTSATHYSAPDSITRGPSGGPQFTPTYTYDPDTSLMISSTNENGQVTTYQYDFMRRVTRTTLPNSVQLNTFYDPAPVSPTITNSNSANSAVTLETLDGLGHVTQADNKNGSTLLSSVKYGYDHLWQRTQSSNPYAPGDSVVYTTVSYDALGRVTQVTPPSGGSQQYSYSGSTVTITDPAGKQRRNTSNAIGLLTEVDEPGETFAGSDSSGTLTINGTLQGQTGSGSPAAGTVTISGEEQSTVVDNCQDFGGSCPRTIWDSGTVSITVNGHVDSVSYNMSSTPATIASALATAINSDSAAYVTASASGNVVTLTAKTAGTVGNGYSLSVTSDTSDPSDFWPSFGGSVSGSTLSGGVAGTSNYDSGTVNVTVGSFTASAPYSQSSNNTASLVATALVGSGSTGLNRSGSPVHATATGASISLTYNTVGAAGNVSVTAASSPSDPTHFPSGSFSGSASLAGGLDSYSTGLSHPFATTYTYDVLNNLTAVSQAAGNVNGLPVSGQPRSYAYDSLGRLTSTTTPESGTASVYYTTSGGGICAVDPSLACRVQDARGVTKTLTYDGNNRQSGVQYSDGTPSVTYTYDTGGAAANARNRLTNITENSNSQTFTYDILGRTPSVAQVIDGITYTTSYTYNLASQVTSITYPSGRVVTQSVDGIGRLSSIADPGVTYLSGLSYNAAGAPLGYTLGNGVQATFGYNDHSQLASLRYYKSGTSPDLLNLAYDYTTGVSGNNGQIQAMRYYTVPGTEDATKSEYFTYDPWLHLSNAQTGTVSSIAGTFSMQWGYDRFGNRLTQTLTGGNLSVNQPVFTMDPTTNRITNSGYTYDAAGNLTGDGVNTYTYDGANRQTKYNVTVATYSYFGPLRIKKVVPGTPTTTTTVYIYSGTQPIAEYTNGTLTAENIYSGSRLLAVVAPGSTTYYHFDHLSTRAETDATGTPVRSSGTLPFGDTWYVTGNSTKWKFTTYERDIETGTTVDYAQYRFYHSTQGRYLGPDWLGGSLANPQSLNRYAYVGSDPINRTDPAGLGWGNYALCMLTDKGDFTSNCARLVVNPEFLFMFCSGPAMPGSAGPKSFCDPACPMWEAAFCGNSGTVLLISQNQHTGLPVFSLGVGLNACGAATDDERGDVLSPCYVPKDTDDPSLTRLQRVIDAVTGNEQTCDIGTLVEAVKPGEDHITSGPCAERSITLKNGNIIWVPINPMGPDPTGLQPIPGRTPFVPPVIPPVTTVPHL
jgi:RHS repeat-associated protein